MLSVLNNRTYRHLFTAQVIALVGTGLMTVALGLLAYELAGADAGAVLGTALAIKMLAYAGVAPVAQAFADRLPRRSLLVALDLVRAAVALCLPFVTEVWQVYVLIFVHALVLILGAHYTYSRVPLGFWVQDAFDLARNHYDRLGHLAQGFIPGILAREILLRCSPLVRGKWLFAVSVAFCLAFSAFYEMIEWWAALIAGKNADAFLATQGDPWDTQWDMFMALIGACSALVLLSRLHDRALARLGLKT